MKQKIVAIILILVILIPTFLSTYSLAIDNTNDIVEEKVEDTKIIEKEEKDIEETQQNEIQSKEQLEEQTEKVETQNIKTQDIENKEEQEEVEPKETETENVEKEDINQKVNELQTMSVQINGAVQNIEEGIYEIYTCVNGTKVIDIEGSNKSNNANVEIYERGHQNNQKFRVKLNDDGTYTFFALHSNKVLDVSATSNGNVCQYTSHGGDNQKWYIKPSENGYYNIISKSNGKYLDVYQGQGNDRQNIQVYKGHGKASQRFKFSKVITTGEKTIKNGIYQIYSKVAENRLLEVPNNEKGDEVPIKTGVNKNVNSQRFQVTYNNDGTYTILVLHTGKALDVKYGSGKNKAIVQQFTKHGGESQKWIIQKNSDGTYSLIAKCNGLALDVNEGSTQVGATIQTYNFHGKASQTFVFEEYKMEKGTRTLEDGTYQILSKINNQKVMELNGGSTENGAIVQMSQNNNSLHQKYDIVYTNDGYYKIVSKKSNKVLTVQGVNVGSAIIQEDDKDLDTQRWILRKDSESIYSIVSKCGNLYITVPDANIKDGQTLQLNEKNNSMTQKFILVNETPKDDIKQINDGVYQIITKGNTCFDITGASYDNSANLLIWNNTKMQHQKYQITKINGTNYYKIIAVHSAKSLCVQNQNINPGANVVQYAYTGSDNQQWLLKDCGDGYYNIISKQSGLCLDVTGGQVSSNGTNVELWYSNDSNSQKFQLLPINIINNDSYKISNKANKNKFFDVYGSSLENNGNIQLWTDNGSNNQIFRVESTDNEYYKIIARHSNKVLTVTSDNNVVQKEDIDSENQKWIIETIGHNYYKIKSKSKNLYLHISDGNVQVEKVNQSDSQIFQFNNLPQRKGIDVSEFNGGMINWQYVKRSGVDYAMIRIGYRGYRNGNFAEDKYFRQNIREAKRAGIKVGVYFYTQAITEKEAEEEAIWTLNKIKESGYENKIDYPIAIDTEGSGADIPGRADILDVKTRTAVCKAFCETIKKNGYRPMIYASKNWFYNNLNVEQLNQYNIWLAHYTGSASKPTDYKYHYEIWQYTSSGQVMGIQGRVDMNICYQSY